MITQCPSCQTRFRLPLDQVASSRGEVLCGECRAQFNALDYLVIEDGLKPGKPTLTDRASKSDEAKSSNTLFLPIDEDVIANLLSDGTLPATEKPAEGEIESHQEDIELPPQLTPIPQSTTPTFTDTLIQQAL
ncbi:MAG: zinc-ribbon domain-containing protein, partial [Gammaproteobacteria bacterium]|nr:zinc-ribbon domain-containing protein [Gammaproteobacteria bacterium]